MADLFGEEPATMNGDMFQVSFGFKSVFKVIFNTFAILFILWV